MWRDDGPLGVGQIGRVTKRTAAMLPAEGLGLHGESRSGSAPSGILGPGHLLPRAPFRRTHSRLPVKPGTCERCATLPGGFGQSTSADLAACLDVIRQTSHHAVVSPVVSVLRPSMDWQVVDGRGGFRDREVRAFEAIEAWKTLWLLRGASPSSRW